MRSILTFDSTQRATAAQILQHPWLAAQGAAPDRPLDNVVITRLRNFAGMTRLRKAAILAAASSLRCVCFEGAGVGGAGSGASCLPVGLREGSSLPAAVLHACLAVSHQPPEQTRWTPERLPPTAPLLTSAPCFTVSPPPPPRRSHEEIHGLRELFKSFDKNGDGHITLDELREGLAHQGVLADGEVEQVGPWAAAPRRRLVAWLEPLCDRCQRSHASTQSVQPPTPAPPFNPQILRDTDVDGNGVIDYEVGLGVLALAATAAVQQECSKPVSPRGLQVAAAGVSCRRHGVPCAPADIGSGGPCCAVRVQEFVASTVNLNLLEREEVCIKAFQKLDKVGGGVGQAGG